METSPTLPPVVPESAAVDHALLRRLAQQTTMSTEAIERARSLAGIAPTAADWQKVLVRIGALGAAACASAALVCFIAYNWDALGRWFRFALFEGALVLAVLIAVMFAHKRLVHNGASVFALFALGGLLAFTGQTYQTGADTYQLFVGWAALALPWLFAVRWWGYTLLWFLIAQLGVTTWANQIPSRDFGAEPTTIFIGIVAINALFAIAFYAARRFAAFDHRWLWRLALLFALGWASFCSFSGNDLLGLSHVDRNFHFTRFDTVAAVTVALTFFACSRVGRMYFDATVLYVAWFCGLFIVLRWVLSGLDTLWRDAGSGFFLAAALLAGGVTLGTVVIRNLSKQHEALAQSGSVTQ